VKKKLIYTLATLALLFSTAGIYTPTTHKDEPPPLCNPFTDPLCKP
jgi:hypothetical protein